MKTSLAMVLAISVIGVGWAEAQSTRAFTNARIIPISGPATAVVIDGVVVSETPQ